MLQTSGLQKVVLFLLLAFLIAGAIYYAKPFLVPLCFGGLLAMLFLPLSRWFESKKIPKGLSILLCIIIFLGLITGIIWLISWQISDLASESTDIENKIQKMREDERNALFSFVRTQSKRYASDDHILFLEDMSGKLPGDTCLNHYLSIVYNNASWYRLFDRNFKKSIEFAKKGTAVAITPRSRLDYIYVNMAHAHLLSGSVAEARRYYRKFAGSKNFSEKNCAYAESTVYNRDVMISDLQTFAQKKMIPDTLKDDVASIIQMLNAIELPASSPGSYNSFASALTDSSIMK